MANKKSKFKKGDKFFHPGQNLFVEVDQIDFYEGVDKGFLYSLKCFKFDNDPGTPWKRYYEHKILQELVPLKPQYGQKVLFGK